MTKDDSVSPTPPEDARTFKGTLARVLTVQLITLLALWALQSFYK